MEEMDIIAILLAIAGFACVVLAVGFVLFLLFEDFFRKLFKMKKNDGTLGGPRTNSSPEKSDKKE